MFDVKIYLGELKILKKISTLIFRNKVKVEIIKQKLEYFTNTEENLIKGRQMKLKLGVNLINQSVKGKQIENFRLVFYDKTSIFKKNKKIKTWKIKNSQDDHVYIKEDSLLYFDEILDSDFCRAVKGYNFLILEADNIKNKKIISKVIEKKPLVNHFSYSIDQIKRFVSIKLKGERDYPIELDIEMSENNKWTLLIEFTIENSVNKAPVILDYVLLKVSIGRVITYRKDFRTSIGEKNIILSIPLFDEDIDYLRQTKHDNGLFCLPQFQITAFLEYGRNRIIKKEKRYFEFILGNYIESEIQNRIMKTLFDYKDELNS